MVSRYMMSSYVYGLFIVLMLFAFMSALPGALLFLVTGNDPRRAFQFVVQRYWRLFLKLNPLVGKITIEHPHNLNRVKPAVYAISHQSSIDFVLIGSMIDNFLSVSNHPVSDFWLFCRIPRWVGVFYMPKENTSASIEGYNRLGDALSRGASVFLFPEGTRNFSSELKPFHKGAFRLAQDYGVPVVPVVIDGTGKIAAKGSNLARTQSSVDITVSFLDPVYPDEGEKLRDYVNRVKAVMQARVERSFV